MHFNKFQLVSVPSLSLSLTQIDSGEVSYPVVNAERSTTGVVFVSNRDSPVGFLFYLPAKILPCKT